MPMDAVFLRALTEEIRPVLTGLRIEKIFQPARDQIVLNFRGNLKLLLCAGANAPRAHFTKIARENPASPPMFCMLLRKHLTGGKIVGIQQPSVERLIKFELDCMDELGRPGRRSLILEAMGRRSNLILLDDEGRILDCLRRVDSDMSASRQLLPGLFYRPPDAGNRTPFLDETESGFTDRLNNIIKNHPEQKLEKFLLDCYFGFSPLLAREIAFRTSGEPDGRICDLDIAGQKRFRLEFSRFQQDTRENKFTPFCLKRENVPVEFSCVAIAQYGETWERFPDFSSLMDAFYDIREQRERVRIRGAELIRAAKTALERTRRKLALQEKDYAAAQNRDDFRIKGDLITANIYAIQKGMKILTCRNFYNSDQENIEIILDPRLSPQQNAANYYKRYTKLKNAEKYLKEQIQQAREDIFYLESVLEELDRAESEQDFIDIRHELIENGFLRVAGKKSDITRGKDAGKKSVKNAGKSGGAGKKSGKSADKIGRPREFEISNGFRVLVGRNNRQNDKITKNADYRDIWLHTQKIHGSHVILCTNGREADENIISEAAAIAAYYSQARDSSRVPVDYALVRYVKKPAGARPGMVVYTNYKTIYITPKAPENNK